MLRRIVTFT